MLTQLGRENSTSAVFSLYWSSLKLRLFSNRFCIQAMKNSALNVCSSLGPTNFCHISASLWNDFIFSPERFELLIGGKPADGASVEPEKCCITNTPANSVNSVINARCRSSRKSCPLTSRVSQYPNTGTQAHMQHCQSWGACSLRGPVCILSEGHAEKDKWWYTADFNSQATPRFPPWLLYTQPKSKVAQNNRSGGFVVGRLQWESLASWQQLKWELEK